MNKIDAGNTAWLLISTALVLIMMPGLALFYGGLVRTKNVLSTFMHTLVALGVVTIQWAFFGYSLAFGPDVGGVIGSSAHFFLNGVGLEPRAGMTIPHLLFMVYQLMFAAITPALVSGAFAERISFRGYILFVIGLRNSARSISLAASWFTSPLGFPRWSLRSSSVAASVTHEKRPSRTTSP
jgi:Amt family ammonium transporter